MKPLIAAIIPARGGSVRILRKNIKTFRGKPIIGYSIQAARESMLFDRIIVSTDDSEIDLIAREHGAKVVIRSAKDDGSKGTQEVARDVLVRQLDISIACVIYPTCPLLEAADLVDGFEALGERNHYAMSVGTEPLADAGCFYWGQAGAFRRRVPLIGPHTAMVPLPPERVCDINTPEDWARAERMYDEIHNRL